MFFELVSILSAIVPDYGNDYMTTENNNWTSFKNFAPKLNLNHNRCALTYSHNVEGFPNSPLLKPMMAEKDNKLKKINLTMCLLQWLPKFSKTKKPSTTLSTNLFWPHWMIMNVLLWLTKKYIGLILNFSVVKGNNKLECMCQNSVLGWCWACLSCN